jgi:hypothetical protein
MSEIRMTEQELRAIIRDAIARQAAAAPTPGSGSVAESLHPSTYARGALSIVEGQASGLSQASGALVFRSHASHGLLPVPSGDGPCLIEPAVMCNHCGYCKSYGH